MSTLELYPGMKVLVIEDQPHPLEEDLQVALEDDDNNKIMSIFVDLYKEGKMNDIKYILSRQLFNDKHTAKAIERIKVEAQSII